MTSNEQRQFGREMAAIWDDGATDDFIEALQSVSEASGPFNRDPALHLQNCIREMQRTAVNVLRKHGITPRREDCAIDGETIPPAKS